MTAPQEPVWSIKPHTQAKHELLRHYLGAWYPVMASREQRLIFIDGFAGPGIYKAGEPGSPVIALRALLEHPAFPRHKEREFDFHFIEADRHRLERLQSELQCFYPLPRNVKVTLHPGTFEGVGDTLANDLGRTGANGAPILAFVDPFGVSGVPIELVRKLLASRKCEMVLTFMVGDLNRFLVTPEMRAQGERLFGTTDFSGIERAPQGERTIELVRLFEQQLGAAAGFRYALHFEMLRSNNSVAYYLVYATKHKKGVEKFKDAMWKVDPSTGCRFSDRDYSQGSLLTGDHVDVSPLQQQVAGEFGGHAVDIGLVEDFALLRTVFRRPHLMTVLRNMERDRKLEVTRPGSGRSGFPKGTQVRFNSTLGI